MLKRLLLLLCAALTSLPLLAYDFQYYELYFVINSEDPTTCAVTSRPGEKKYTGHVTIPASVSNAGKIYSVTKISNRAFSGCDQMWSVSIPNSVTEIGEYAFSGCYGMSKAEFMSIEHLCSINFANSSANPLSYAHRLYIGGAEVAEVDIPNSVTSIGNHAFSSCYNLTSVTIPVSVASIGYGVFFDCPYMTEITVAPENNFFTSINGVLFSKDQSVLLQFPASKKEDSFNIPNSVTSIGESAFYGCRGLTSVIIPNSVTYIGESAFYGCRGLTSVIIPNSVAKIAYETFRYCSGLTSVTIGNSVTEIGGYSFDCCSSLTAVTIGTSVTYIGEGAFWGCSGLTSVTIPNSVTTIGGTAFYGCSGLTSVTIPNSVTEIGGSAFSSCSGLTSVTIPNSVTSIGGGAFYGCSGLTSVTIPNSVTYIGDGAFKGCSGVKELTLEDGDEILSLGYNEPPTQPWYYEKYGKGLFWDCPLATLYLGRNLSYSNSYYPEVAFLPFKDKTLLRELTIGNYVTEIGSEAFSGCTGLTSAIIGNSVTSIEYEVFKDCSSLTSVTIPNSVTSIGNHAFYNCSSLTSVTVGNSVTSIQYEVFKGCKSLTSVTIPNSVTEIGAGAFSGCSSLTSVNIPDSVTSIGSEAFRSCSSLTSVIIPKSVTEIGENAFLFCSGLKKSAYPNNLMNPFSNGFSIPYPEDAIFEDGCIFGPNKYGVYFAPLSFEGDYIMPHSMLTVADNAFACCSGLTSVKTSARLRTIGNHAFDGCNLREVVIAPTVKSIGESAFANNAELKEVKIGYGITEIGDNAFAGCNEIANIYITASKPPVATDNTFSNYRSALWLNNKKVQNSYFEAENCWYWFGENMKNLVVADSVKILDQNIAGKVGETIQLEAAIYPEDATLKDIFWKSTNTDVATVDSNGLLTFVAPLDEECEIVAMTMYENVEVAEISVKTLPESGDDDPDEGEIEEVVAPAESGEVEVYNLRGVKVGDSLEGLPHGVYIIRQGSRTTKHAI